MKPNYRLFKRRDFFYCENIKTGQQESLHTKDKGEAGRLLMAKNEAANTHDLRLALGQAYLTMVDPEMATRTWSEVFDQVSQRGKETTQKRAKRAFQSQAFSGLQNKVILETSARDFLEALADGKSSTSHYLKLAHALALDLGWLVKPVLVRKCWPKVKSKDRRAITWAEHCRIIAGEKNPERRRFYELLWETGASQTDAANLDSRNIDWPNRMLVYQRQKTGRVAKLVIGSKLKEILKQLPATGRLFPSLASWSSVRRSIEFHRRCKISKVVGVSLHSYRYAWAERAFSAGYPERYAQAALGHESRAIHHAYSRKAEVNCPSLEQYEKEFTRVPSSSPHLN